MTYFEKEMNMDRLFGGAKGYRILGEPTKHNAKYWMERIENALSPENLSCDGELPRAQVLAKRRELEGALQYCRNLLNGYVPFAQRSAMPDEGAKDGDRFMGFADSFSARALFNRARRERTRSREITLNAAVNAGFKTGARVLISNGVRGVIVKINRTRVKVKGDDGRMWSVPPRCMELLKVR